MSISTISSQKELVNQYLQKAKENIKQTEAAKPLDNNGHSQLSKALECFQNNTEKLANPGIRKENIEPQARFANILAAAKELLTHIIYKTGFNTAIDDLKEQDMRSHKSIQSILRALIDPDFAKGGLVETDSNIK